MGRGPRYAAKASWQKPHGERFYKKGGSSSLPSAPSGAGSGGARLWVKGPVPCRFLGQRPKLTEDAFKLFLYKNEYRKIGANDLPFRGIFKNTRLCRKLILL